MYSNSIEMLATRIETLEKNISILVDNKSKLIIENTLPISSEKSKLSTEDTGKEFEMAICICKDIIYDGKFKYSNEEAKKLADRLIKSNFNTYCPGIYKHSAKKGGRYDFTNDDDKKNKYLSAKSSKEKSGRVAPSVIGQPKPEKFCEIIKTNYISDYELKKYIQNNIKDILNFFINYTFDCPNIYYNKAKNTIQFITIKNKINWENYEFKWTQNYDKWNVSSILKIKMEDKYISLMEFQFHKKSRTNMANRWFYDNFIDIFKDDFSIIHF